MHVHERGLGRFSQDRPANDTSLFGASIWHEMINIFKVTMLEEIDPKRCFTQKCPDGIVVLNFVICFALIVRLCTHLTLAGLA